MTAVHYALNAKGYEMIVCASYEDQQPFNQLGGRSLKNDWTPPHVERVRPTRQSSNKPADLPYSHFGFVMRCAAVEALHDVLEAHGEILPLATMDGVELFVFNPRFVIDAIDKERSTYDQIPETDTVWIRKYVFIESAIGDIEIFQATFGGMTTYFSDRFVARVKAAKLKGTEFVKLWSSDDR